MTPRDLALPYAHLNLRWNPFGQVPPSLRARLAVLEIGPGVERLGEPGFALQFLGDKGRGKTTHLLALRERFPDAPYIHIPEGPLPPIPEAPILFLDETQRIPRRRRKRIFSRGRAYVLGTHEDHTRELEAAGIESWSVTVSLSTPGRLAEIVRRRIEWARRGPGPVPSVTQRSIRGLMERFGDDVRGIEGCLYDAFLGLEEVRDVEV